ncbi:UbiE/COQ5 family methyltransferase [Pseudohyphozyma bogoriensis]|nr:UbiE/COQ5 family methyltransferase [Pseudohyphozyma bogoriensis]
MSASISKPDFSKVAKQAATMERFTGPAAEVLAVQSGATAERATTPRILDNAAGAGILTAKVMARKPADQVVEIVCGDFEPAMVEAAKERIDKEGWKGVTAQQADALNLPFPDAHFSHVLINFGTQSMPDIDVAMKEAHRVLVPGGVLGFTTWLQPGWIPLYQLVKPEFSFTNFFAKSKWFNDTDIASSLVASGFTDVKITPHEHPMPLPEARSFVETMSEVMPQVFTEEVCAKSVEILEDKRAKGEDIESAWKSLVVTASKA